MCYESGRIGIIYELIDTLWNVNVQNKGEGTGIAPELIDTLWNVNTYEGDGYAPDGRINRYIMECKLYYLFYLEKNKIELIDTLWNVNNDIVYLVFCAKKRINRYIMECKSACIASATSQAIVN